MNLILDTHTFLWFSEDSPRLSKYAKSIIEQTDNNCYISIASFWEMAIKISLDKLKISFEFKDLMHEISIQNFTILPIHFEHTLELTTMNFYHKDPFDRLIIAQAMVENLTVVSADNAFDKYGIKRIW
ncbi:MAG: type II toxin-antitoxin system VapC family toxin [Bacteroidia bacterium]|nr:type II toxin-antitoxin system VapC family toxin [Bacteroidia bacterium]